MWQKIKDSFRSFMVGRYGGDQLSRVQVWTGFAIYIIAIITGLGILSYLGLAMYVWAFFRIFSRNVEKRAAENQLYLQKTANVRRNATQAANRFKNRKQYKYFRCPKCKSYLKLPRNVGEVTVTCGKCRHQFRKKA